MMPDRFILNDYIFTDDEWSRFWNDTLANSKLTIQDKTKLIQEDHVQNLKQVKFQQ